MLVKFSEVVTLEPEMVNRPMKMLVYLPRMKSWHRFSLKNRFNLETDTHTLRKGLKVFLYSSKSFEVIDLEPFFKNLMEKGQLSL